MGIPSSGDSVQWGFCPVGILSSGDSVQWGFCPVGILSSGDSVQWGFRPVGILSSGDSVQWGFCPVGILSSGDSGYILSPSPLSFELLNLNLCYRIFFHFTVGYMEFKVNISYGFITASTFVTESKRETDSSLSTERVHFLSSSYN